MFSNVQNVDERWAFCSGAKNKMFIKPCAIVIRFLMRYVPFVFQKAVKMLIDNVDKVPVSIVTIWSYTQLINVLSANW